MGVSQTPHYRRLHFAGLFSALSQRFFFSFPVTNGHVTFVYTCKKKQVGWYIMSEYVLHSADKPTLIR